MWYVIQTMTGQEAEIILFFEKMISEKLYQNCFVPKGEWLKRLGGEWQLQVSPLFPGYVFVETNHPDELFQELKSVPKLTKILGGGHYEFTPLEAEEEAFLRAVMGDRGDYVVRLSVAEVADNGTIVIAEGLLKQFEKDIVKVNLRKRFALLSIKMMGQERTVIFGIKLRKDK